MVLILFFEVAQANSRLFQYHKRISKTVKQRWMSIRGKAFSFWCKLSLSCMEYIFLCFYLSELFYKKAQSIHQQEKAKLDTLSHN